MMMHSKTMGRTATQVGQRSCSVARPVPTFRRSVSVKFTSSDAAAVAATVTKIEQAPLPGVYGKPLTKSETAALKAAVTYLNKDNSLQGTQEELRNKLMGILKIAATTKTLPLDVVEGSMVLLEQMYLKDAPKGGKLCGVMTKEEMLCRWQLVIGADVGSIQYIPVVEELEVDPSGDTFALDTDINVIFTGFSGTSAWLSAGHLQYHVKRVRIELRLPEKFKFWVQDVDRVVKVDDGKGTCRPDMTMPAVTIPLPFPANELFIFSSNGDLGVLRSKLGGLILLVNKTPVAERAKLASK